MAMARPGGTERRLSAISGDLQTLRSRVALLDEQLAFLREVADDARTQAAVADHPLVDRDRDRAADDLRRAQRERDEGAAQIASLLAEQDALLERLLEQAGTSGKGAA